MRKQILALAFGFFSVAAHGAAPAPAKINLTTAVVKRSALEAPAPNNRLVIDAFPLLASGVALDYEYTFLSKFTAGPRFSYMSTRSESTEDGVKAKFQHTITSGSLIGRYFFNFSPARSAPYLLGGATVAQVQTKAQFDGAESGSANDNGFGGLAGAGYQFINSQLIRGTRMLFNIGLLYGYGYSVTGTAETNFYEPTKIRDLKLDYGLFAEAAVGFLF